VPCVHHARLKAEFASLLAHRLTEGVVYLKNGVWVRGGTFRGDITGGRASRRAEKTKTLSPYGGEGTGEGVSNSTAEVEQDGEQILVVHHAIAVHIRRAAALAATEG